MSYNKILIYNVFPNNYSSIAEIIEKLPKIKDVGFNTIWINPFHLSNQTSKSRVMNLFNGTDSIGVSSIYSMYSTRQFRNNFNTNDIIKLNAIAKSYNIKLIFDLVLNHVAPNSFAEFDIIKLILSDKLFNIKSILCKNLEKLAINPFFDNIFEKFQNEFIKVFNELLEINYSDFKALTKKIIENNFSSFLDMSIVCEMTDNLLKYFDRIIYESNVFNYKISNKTSIPFSHINKKSLAIIKQFVLNPKNRFFDFIKIYEYKLSKNPEKDSEIFSEVFYDLFLKNTNIFELAIKKESLIKKQKDVYGLNNQEFSLLCNLCENTTINNSSNILELFNILKESNIFSYEINKDESFSDAIKIQYSSMDTKILDKIINEFWFPFISKYLAPYPNGFDFEGIRIDCAWAQPPFLREKIYKFAKSIKPNCIIFEENLFGYVPLYDALKKTSKVGADCMTGDLYYQLKNQYGFFDEYVNLSSGERSSLVNYGCINFTGTHDDVPLALYVARNIALNLIYNDKEYFNLLPKDFRISIRKKFTFSKTFEFRLIHYLYPYILEIIEKVNLKKDNFDILFSSELKKRIFTIVFGSNTGYYMFDGDENINLMPASIFNRQTGEKISSSDNFNLFNIESDVINDILNKMLIEISVDRKDLRNFLKEIRNIDNIAIRQKMLLPYIDALKQEIIIGRKLFNIKKNMESTEVKQYIIFRNLCKQNNVKNFDNMFEIPEDKERFKITSISIKEFITEVNQVFSKLPTASKSFWFQYFELNNDVSVIVRKNGYGICSDTDIIFCNNNTTKQYTITDNDIKNLAISFQNRVIPEKERIIGNGNTNYDLAYMSITGELKQCQTRFYKIGNLDLNLHKSKEKVSGIVSHYLH